MEIVTDEERFANFMNSIQQLRNAGHDITDTEAYNMFAANMARHIQHNLYTWHRVN